MLCVELGWGLGLTAGRGVTILAGSTREPLRSWRACPIACEVVQLRGARPFSLHGTSVPGPEQGSWQRAWVP